jgi:hypothetical protein
VVNLTAAGVRRLTSDHSPGQARRTDGLRHLDRRLRGWAIADRTANRQAYGANRYHQADDGMVGRLGLSGQIQDRRSITASAPPGGLAATGRNGRTGRSSGPHGRRRSRAGLIFDHGGGSIGAAGSGRRTRVCRTTCVIVAVVQVWGSRRNLGVCQNRIAPAFALHGDRLIVFSARAEAPSPLGGRERSMVGFEAACRVCGLFAEPFRRLIPDRLKPDGRRVQSLRALRFHARRQSASLPVRPLHRSRSSPDKGSRSDRCGLAASRRPSGLECFTTRQTARPRTPSIPGQEEEVRLKRRRQFGGCLKVRDVGIVGRRSFANLSASLLPCGRRWPTKARSDEVVPTAKLGSWVVRIRSVTSPLAGRRLAAVLRTMTAEDMTES